MENKEGELIVTFKLQEQLMDKVEGVVNKLFTIINEKLVEYAAEGRTELIIYFPIWQHACTVDKYDTKIYSCYDLIKNDIVQDKLKKKFRSNGIKIYIYSAIEQNSYHHHLIKYSGKIIHCKWKKDYSDKSKSCLII